MTMNWNAPEIRALVRSALREDHARADLTTRLLIRRRWRLEATIVAKQSGVVAGLPLAARVLRALDATIRFKAMVSDGSAVKPGQRLALIRGKARAVLSAERAALNALQHLSGIATFTREQVNKLKGTGARLYDTRKTLPGWRLLQKYAVRCGGAANQRMSLGDAILIKENHLKVVRLAGSDWYSRVRSLPIQLEVQTARDLRDALRLKPQRVLLDNLTLRALKRMTRILRKAVPGIESEFTGGVRPKNLRFLAKLRPERISMGRLTHSFPAFDCSLDITRVYAH